MDFPPIDREGWRARAKLDPAALSPAPGIEGVAVRPLYDGPPAQPLVVPPRAAAHWGCLLALPTDAAEAVVASLRVGEVDGVVVDGAVARRLDATRFACWIEDAGGEPPANAAAWLADPHAPDAAIDVATVAARAGGSAIPTWLCDGAAWHDRGASATDEVAIVLAGLLVALAELGTRGLEPAAACARVVLRVGMGGDVILDVAKLRALRGLVHAAIGRLGTNVMPIVHARTGRSVRSRLDADTNLVRATYEAFAAACGGADALIVEAHQRDHARPVDAHRWARNLVHVGRLESHLDAVDDPLAGAWAIEHVTAELAEAAWRRVGELTRAGGLGQAIATGTLAADVARTAAARQAAVASDAAPIVGVSKFAPKDRVLLPPGEAPPWLDLCAPFETTGGGR